MNKLLFSDASDRFFVDEGGDVQWQHAVHDEIDASAMRFQDARAESIDDVFAFRRNWKAATRKTGGGWSYLAGGGWSYLDELDPPESTRAWRLHRFHPHRIGLDRYDRERWFAVLMEAQPFDPVNTRIPADGSCWRSYHLYTLETHWIPAIGMVLADADKAADWRFFNAWLAHIVTGNAPWKSSINEGKL